MTDAKMIAYDPIKTQFLIDGGRVTGLNSGLKVSASRRLNGVCSVKIYLQAQSGWVLTLKKRLGHAVRFEAEYTGEGVYFESTRFVSDMVIKGYDVDYTGEIPVFVFLLESE